MTSAVSGVGSYIFVANNVGDFVKIDEVLTISCPSLSSEQVDVTSLDSDAGYKETIGGFLDSGEVQFECNWIKTTGQTRVRNNLSDRKTRHFKILLNGGGGWSFNAVVTGFNLNMETGSAITATATLKVSGAATWIESSYNNVLIIGDSYAQRTSDPTLPWYAQYLKYAHTISNVGSGGAKLATGGSPIKDDITTHLANYPEAGTVIVNGGSNDIKGPLSAAPDFDSVKAGMAEIIGEILDAGRQCIVLDIPPLGDYEFLDQDLASPSYGAEKLAGIIDYNIWLGAYAGGVGAKSVSIWSILNDGAGGIDDAYDTDGLHANAAGCQAMAAAVDLAIVKDAEEQGNAAAALRRMPNPDQMSVGDMLRIKTLVNGVGDEWDNVIEFWMLKQTDLSNAYTGLKGSYTATVAAGTPSAESGGMLLEAGEYLDAGLDVDDIPQQHSIGFMLSACTTTASNLYAYGGGGLFGSAVDFRQHSSQGFKARVHSTGAYTYAGKDFSDAVDQVVETVGTVTGSNVVATIYENGVALGSSASVTAETPSTRDFYINANNLDTGVDSGMSATWFCLYITDGTTTPATWNTVIKALS